MHRSQLLSLLKDYQVRFPNEKPMSERMMAFVETNPRCFERSLAEGHITGSSWLVDSSGERVLLTHHRKLNRWLQLGGHADGDSDVLEVAVREAREESGILELEVCSPFVFDIDIHLIPARGMEPAHFHYDCRFAVQALTSDIYTISAESHDLKWVRIRDVSSLTTEESMLRMARKWLEELDDSDAAR
jgi:8-oxo-dGTP pyrophosphatase MutT (NUDIX family)